MKLCSEPGCSTRYFAKGLCRVHYYRVRRNGHTKLIAPTQEERFWAKVNKTETCWLWTGGLVWGYPSFWVDGRTVRAHRWAYEHFVGPIPEGYTIDHVKANGCTSKACVKALADEHGPGHLEAVTVGDNNRRYAETITHCPQGHPYDEANTQLVRGGERHCRACKRERMRDPRVVARRRAKRWELRRAGIKPS